MYRVIYKRYGKTEVAQEKTRAEANRTYNSISNEGEGFPICIVNEDAIIIRDGFKNVIGVTSKEGLKGKTYLFDDSHASREYLQHSYKHNMQ